ncbi:DUF2809 domain-containing protein [Flammeovirga kamogawensis]|nr:DUF2809 domain-containing protein [Flammeovirga kamogawensis]
MIIAFIILLGLYTRSKYLNTLIYSGIGDYLYALMIYFIAGFIFNKKGTGTILILSILICYLIEFQQLYQADWIVKLRANKLIALVLGRGFLWSDLVAYTIGTLTGFFLEKSVLKIEKST